MFYILITIALIAMLTAYMARGNRTQESTLTSEQAKLAAQEIIDYGSALANAVQKLRLRGIDERGIGFDNQIFITVDGNLISPNNHNPNCSSDTCKIFSTGGQITAKISNPQSYGLEFTPANHIVSPGSWVPYIITMNAVGSANSDLTIVNSGVKRDVCLAINKLLGIDNPDGMPPAVTGGGVNEYNGQAFPTGQAVWGADSIVSGKTEYCYTLAENVNEHKFYNYIKVLLAR
jgi:hypothetical protein